MVLNTQKRRLPSTVVIVGGPVTQEDCSRSSQRAGGTKKKEPGNYRGQTGKHDPPGRLTDGQAATERSGRRAN